MPSPYEPEGPQGLGNKTFAGRHLRVKAPSADRPLRSEVSKKPITRRSYSFGRAARPCVCEVSIRAVLLPASMTLLGDANWYLPKWLEWLPRLEREKLPEAPPVATR
jgi:hypothetical protein